MDKEKFLDKAYGLDSAHQTRAHYDDWSASYDDEIGRNGYATPARIAAALAHVCDDLAAPVLDFGCGTGLSGVALSQRGFLTIDGIDLSQDMITQAGDKACYRDLHLIEPDAPLNLEASGHKSIVACGAIGAGAAPLSVFDSLMQGLPRGGFFALSFNDHSLEDPIYEAKLDSYVQTKTARLLHREHGDHLPGINLGCVVYVIEKT